MSRVFVAHDRTLGRDVVVKVLPPEMAAAVSVQRFNREIQLAAKLQHPHIVPLHSTGEISGLPYFTMPFVEGESLRAHLAKQGGELPVAECVRILRDIACALSYAHRQGVVHRDIKPENVLLSSGSAVVTDFGVGKALSASTTEAGGDTLTTRGVAIGTPAYMSPEQASADPSIDHRSDIYAWGVVAYEMLAGQTPFAGRGVGALIAAQIAEPPEAIERRRATVPPGLAALVMRALAKRPADRPQTASELVDALDGLLATGLTSGASTPAGRKTEWRKAQPWLGVAAAATAVVLIAAALLAPKLEFGAGSGAPAVRSIAVLPFLNLGGDQSDEYFSDGMSDELSTALGKIPGLQVASRTSTFSFKGERDTDVRAIGAKLNVDAVLEGRVRRSGDRLRLFVQLTNVADGLSLWSESYEREVKDVFTVQEDVSRAIASALELRLSGAGSARSAVASVGTDDLQAYDLYLRGRYQWHRRNLVAAASLFEQAAAKDPEFARAHAGIAITYALLPEYDEFPPAEARTRTERAAARALALDTTIAEAHAALGLSRVHAWRWAEAEESYKRAIAIDPRYPTGHQWYGELLYQTGRINEALAHMRESVALDPLAPIASIAYAYALHNARRPSESLVQATKAVELGPHLSIVHRIAAYGAAFSGDCPAALRHADRSIQVDSLSPNNIGDRAHIYGKCGRETEARAAIASLSRRIADDRVLPSLAVAYAGVGETDSAISALERAVERKAIYLTGYSIAADPMFDGIRPHPRYQAVMRAMGLPSSAFAPR